MATLLEKIIELINITIFQFNFDGIDYRLTLWQITIDVIILWFFFKLFFGIYKGDR